MGEYLEESVRPSTNKLYVLNWGKYLDFCQKLGWVSVPASPKPVSAFLVSLSEKSKAKSGALTAKKTIAFFHRLELPLVKDPTDHVMVKRVLKSVSNKWSKPVKKAVPLSSSEVSKLAVILLEGSFKDLRTAAMVLLQFS